MFNRRVAVLFMLLGLSAGWLYWSWSYPPSTAVQASSEPVSAQRRQMDLTGRWDGYSTLRQAWTEEVGQGTGKSPGNTWYSLFNQKRELTLPSDAEFSVAARSFRIPAEWSSRTMLLEFNGVYGHAQVYLNGADSSHKVGEFEGSGGNDQLTIPAAAFRYGADNLLLIQFTGSYEQRSVVFGSAWPALGRIDGKIALEGVVETSLGDLRVNTAWQGDTAVLSIQAELVHHNFMSQGPWQVTAVLSDGSAEVAQASLDVQPEESAAQPFTIQLTVGNPRRWEPQAPYLYQLHLSVLNTSGDQDDLALPVGLSSLSLSGGNILLNGQSVKINGQALTVEQETLIRQTGKISEFLKNQQQKGVNLLYFVGQFPDPLWLQAADQVGMGIWADWPVAAIPNQHLPDPEVFRELVAEGNNHPSLWGWIVGKGLDSQSPSSGYLSQAEKVAGPVPAYVLRLNSASPPGLPVERSPVIQDGIIQGTWGKISFAKDIIPGSTAGSLTGNDKNPFAWPDKYTAVIWLICMVLLAIINFGIINWRYKEIGETKPKRRLRAAWFWHGFLVFGRAGTLAGILTAALFHTPAGLSPWLPGLWPGLELIQDQAPWLIWAVLACGIALLRLVQTGLAAPNLPDSPHPWGLTLWLEQRYRWIVFVAGIWAAVPWGISWLASLAAYFGLSLLFLPWRVRDIHRVGGRYRPLLIVPGLIAFVLALWCTMHWADWLYLWHFLKTVDWKFTLPV